MFFWICFALSFLPLILIVPTKVVGRKKLPKKQGYIIVCNHYSNFDAPLLDIQLRKRLRFLAKKELFKNKFSAFFLKQYGGVAVDREKGDLSAIKNSLKILKQNKPLVIFPEGTRNKNSEEGSLGHLHSGAVVIASMAKVPIVPIVILKRPKAFRKNTIIIGEPFYAENETKTKLTKEEIDALTEQVGQKLTNLRNDYLASLKQKHKNKQKGEN